MSIGADLCALDLIERLEVAREEQNGDILQRRVVLDIFAHLVAVLARHDDVRENEVRLDIAGLSDGVVAVINGGKFEVAVGQGDAHHLLDRDAVISQQDFLRHFLLLWGPRVPKESIYRELST